MVAGLIPYGLLIDIFSRSSQYSTTSVTKAVVCVTLWDANRKIAHVVAAVGLSLSLSLCLSLSLFEWSFTISSTPYNRK